MGYDLGEDRGSVWTFMGGGTFAKIAGVLNSDPAVLVELNKLKNDPTDPKQRTDVIDVIARRTGNYVGQAAIQEAHHVSPADLKLDASNSVDSAYQVLKTGVENEYRYGDSQRHRR